MKSICETRFTKFNKQHVTEFSSQEAEKTFLDPIGVTLNGELPRFFFSLGRIQSDREDAIFRAIHFLKYRVYHEQDDATRQALIRLHDTLRNRILDGNIGLVYKCIRSSPMKRDPNDMLSNASYVLLRAIENFDPWKGFRFSTYACRSIKTSFLSPPSTEDAVHIADPEVVNNVSENKEKASLDEAVLIEKLQLMLRSSNRSGLDQRELEIIRLRFGLDCELMMLQQIGDLMGITKERVRQIEREAKRKLRLALGVV